MQHQSQEALNLAAAIESIIVVVSENDGEFSIKKSNQATGFILRWLLNHNRPCYSLFDNN